MSDAGYGFVCKYDLKSGFPIRFPNSNTESRFPIRAPDPCSEFKFEFEPPNVGSMRVPAAWARFVGSSAGSAFGALVPGSDVRATVLGSRVRAPNANSKFAYRVPGPSFCFDSGIRCRVQKSCSELGTRDSGLGHRNPDVRNQLRNPSCEPQIYNQHRDPYSQPEFGTRDRNLELETQLRNPHT